MADTASGIYHPRNPTASPLWNLLNNHYDDFEKHYEEKYEKKYGEDKLRILESSFANFVKKMIKICWLQNIR